MQFIVVRSDWKSEITAAYGTFENSDVADAAAADLAANFDDAFQVVPLSKYEPTPQPAQTRAEIDSAIEALDLAIARYTIANGSNAAFLLALSEADLLVVYNEPKNASDARRAALLTAMQQYMQDLQE
jgi:hypothetical protein